MFDQNVTNDDRNGSHNNPSVCAFILQKAKEVYDIFGFADFVCQLCFLVFVDIYGKLMFLDILINMYVLCRFCEHRPWFELYLLEVLMR